jgi:hypothetical protein
VITKRIRHCQCDGFHCVLPILRATRCGNVRGGVANPAPLEAETGAPILSESLAYFDCRVSHYTDASDHKIAVCQVVAAATLNPGRPLLYSQTGDMDGSAELYGKRGINT